MLDKKSTRRFLLTYLDMDCECVNGDFCLHVAIQKLDGTMSDEVTYLISCQRCHSWMWYEIPFTECEEFMIEILYHEKNETYFH